MRCRLEEIDGIMPKENSTIIKSSFFFFFNCFACEYLISVKGLDKGKSKLYNTIKAYFISDDFSAKPFFEKIKEDNSLSEFFSYFPKNNKDFCQLELCKNYIFESQQDVNKIIIGDVEFESKPLFLRLTEKK